MKAILLPVVFLVMVSLPAEAQLFTGGLVAGFSASQIDGDSYAGYNKFGLQGGVYIETALTYYLNARFEIRYDSRGASNPASSDNTGYYKLALHYIDIPVVASVRVTRFGYAELGLVPGYLFAVQGRDDFGKIPKDALADFRKFDLGTLIGVRIPVTKKISVNLRYSYSIFTIRDKTFPSAYYTWFGKLTGRSSGNFNNYLTTAVNIRLK